MIIEVIPFDISFDDTGLSYFIKDDLVNNINVGSVVEIPFKNGIILGIISKINSENLEGEIKSIVSIVCDKPILSEYQMKTIYRLSEKYFINIHKVLSVFLPKFIYNFLEKKSFKDLETLDSATRINSDNLIYFCNKIDTFTKIVELIDENGTVIIFPDDFMLDEFLEKYEEFNKKSTIYRNKLSYTKKYKIFIEAYNKTKNILIGTRKILVYNLEAYRKIIYVEDIFLKYLYSYNHKYKNLEILDNLEKFGNFEINIVGKIPSLDLIYKASKGNYKLINN